MAKKVKANGKTFTFDDNVTNDQIGTVVDEYFSSLKKKTYTVESTTTSQPPNIGGMTDLSGIASSSAKTTKIPSPIVNRIEKDLSQPKGLQEATQAYKQSKGEKAFAVTQDIDQIKEDQKAKNKVGGAGDTFMAGVAGVNKGLAKIPRYLYGLAAAPQNFAADMLNKPELQANYDEVLQASGYQSPLSVIDRLGDLASGEEDKYNARVKKYNDDITGSISKGNFSDAGAQIVNNIAGSVPSMMLMATTGGIGNAAKLGYYSKTLLNALPFSSSKMQELADDKSIPEYIKPVTATLNGLAEVIFDQEFGTQAAIQNIVKLFKEGGKEAAEKAAKELTDGYVNKALKELGAAGKSISKGALEEVTTQFAQNITDKYTVNPNKNLMDGVADAAIVGGITTGGFEIGGKILAGRYNKNQKDDLTKLAQQRSDIIDDLDKDEVSDEVKNTLTDALKVVDSKIDGITEDAEAEIDIMPSQVQAVVTDKTREIESLTEQLQSENLSEVTKEVIADKIKVLEAEVNSIIDNANKRQDAIQEPSTESQVSPVGEAGQVIPEGSERVGQSQQGTEATEEVKTQEIKDIDNSKLDLGNGLSLKNSKSDKSSFFIVKDGEQIGSLGVLNAKYFYNKLGISEGIKDNDVVVDSGTLSNGVNIYNENNKRKGYGTKAYIGLLKFLGSELSGSKKDARVVSSPQFSQTIDSYKLWESLYKKGLAKKIGTTLDKDSINVSEMTSEADKEFLKIKGDKRELFIGEDLGMAYEGKPNGLIYNGDIYALDLETINTKIPTQAPPQQTVEQLRAQEQAEYDAMANPKDKVERQKIYDKYDKLITPLIREEAKPQEVVIPEVKKEGTTTELIDVYHGGSVKNTSVASKSNPLFVSENKEQAKEYTKENKGKVSSFKINNNAIATEEKIYEIINKLGLESKEEGWDVNDLNVFELIDKYFSSSLSDSDIQKVFEELEKEGYGGVRFYDTNLKTLKQDIQNIVIFNPELVKDAISKKQEIILEAKPKELIDAEAKLKRAKSEVSKNKIIQDIKDLSTPEQFSQFVKDNPEFSKNLPKEQEVTAPITEDLEVEGEVETPSEAKRKDIEKRRQELLRKLRIKGAQAMSGFNLDMIPDLIKLGATYIEDGILNFKDFAERLKQDSGYNIPEDNTRDIFTKSAESLGKGIRKLPTRIAADEGLSPKLRTIAEKIDAVYQKQNYEEIQTELDKMSKDEKNTIVAKLENVTNELNKEGNVGVLAAIDLINKYESEGDLDGVERVFDIISKSSTVFAQLLRQYGQLKSSTVQGFLSLIEKNMLKKYDVQITDTQKADITKLYEDIKSKTEAAKQALENHIKDLTNKTQKDLGKADIELENSVRLFNDYLDKLKPKTWKGLVDKMIAITQGNLLTLKSLIVNPLANIVQYGNKVASNEVANLLDLVISTLSSTPRTRISGFNLDAMRLSGKSAFSGLKAANRSLLKGATAAEISKYDVSGRLKPVEAWKSLWETLKGKQNITLPGVLTDLLEGIPGSTANLALRLLPYGDLPRNEMAKAYKLVEIGITKLNLKGKDLDRFLLNPDKESLAIAEDYGNRATLQNKTLFYDLINKGIAQFDTPSDSRATAGMKSLGKFITRGLIVPFLKTPINAAVMAFRLSNPIVPLAQAGIELSKIIEYRKEKNIDIKNKKISEAKHKVTGYLGEAIIAQVILMSAVMLVKAGLTSGGVPDKDKKERDFMFQTFGPNQVNLSGLKRLIAGGDPTFKQGDVAISYMPLGLLGAQLGVVTEGYKEREKEAEKQSKVKTAEGKPFYSNAWDANKELGNAVTDNLPASAKYMLDQGFVQGTSAILDAVSKNDYDRWSSQWVKTFTTGLAIPNTVVQTLRASNEYMTNTFDDDQVKNIANTVKNLYGDTEGLPIRYDMFGKKILQTPKGENPYVYHVLDIFRSQQLLQDKDTYNVFILYKKTGDKSVIPSSVSDIVEESRSEFKIKLTPQQTADLQRIVGEERFKSVKKKAPFDVNNNDPKYLEQQAASYARSYQVGLAMGKRRFKKEVLDKIKK